MRKTIRTVLGLVVSIVLFSAPAMAQPGGSKGDKDKNEEHHSRLKFWHLHKTSDKKAKTQAPSKRFQAKSVQMRPASAKEAAPKRDDQKNDQKPEQQEQPEQRRYR